MRSSWNSSRNPDCSAPRLLAVASRRLMAAFIGKNADKRRKNLPRPAKREPIEGLHPVILVVDDVEDSRELYIQYLSFVGYEVYGAANGLAGLDLADRHHPDVVVLDLSMPGMDGWEVCGRLKSQPTPPRVIVVTGHAPRGGSWSPAMAGPARRRPSGRPPATPTS